MSRWTDRHVFLGLAKPNHRRHLLGPVMLAFHSSKNATSVSPPRIKSPKSVSVLRYSGTAMCGSEGVRVRADEGDAGWFMGASAAAWMRLPFLDF
jgi:hypothetical protein